MRVVAVVSTHARAELGEANVTVARLVSIEVSLSDGRPGGRLLVRITEP
jgi:hypothetical protein